MTYRFQLVASAALAAVFLAACDPVTPANPDPLTPPEEAAVPADPAMPAPGTSTDTTGDTAGMGTSSPDQVSPAACATISTDGLCGVTFGMSADEAREAHLGGLHTMGDSSTGEESACYYLGPEEGNYDVGYMVERGSGQRIDIRAPGVVTPDGVEVGMSEAEVEDIYPALERQPNKYVDRDDLIVMMEGGAKLIMETDGAGTISAYRVGRPPAVDYVEGCA
ncbi:MAG TPA: hypothetical protein EYG02_14205 [Henriciella marina]|nr:hypothetical protein [Henriciella marina]